MILRGKLAENGQTVALHIERERISRIQELRERTVLEQIDPDLYIASGFFDLQVNGFAGIDFNGKNLTVEKVCRATQAISATGVTAFFPTLITASFDRL